MSDVGTSLVDAQQAASNNPGLDSFEPWPDCQVHLEHGVMGAALAAQRGDIVVVFDVLSFSTTMSMALEQGASVISLSNAEIDELGGRDAVADKFGAEVVAKRRDDASAKFTLSPASLSKVQSGDRLVLTSLNGAKMVAASVASPALFVASLRSATASARSVLGALDARVARRITLVAAGEHWSSVAPGRDGFRPALEDVLGAGAVGSVLSSAGLKLSVEARVAVQTFEQEKPSLKATLESTVSGRELIAWGFAADVEYASELDATSCVAQQGPDRFFAGAHSA